MFAKPHYLCRVAGLAVAICQVSGCALFGANFQEVAPGAFYRSGQMAPATLRGAIQRHNIATVINLRGTNPDEQWYVDEIDACRELGVEHHDLKWSMRRLPEPESLAEFVRLVEEAPGPLLVHCQGGTHRSGVAAAVFLLMRGADVEEARDQFGPFFDDAPIGELLDMYATAAVPFKEWVVSEYPALHGGLADGAGAAAAAVSG